MLRQAFHGVMRFLMHKVVLRAIAVPVRRRLAQFEERWRAAIARWETQARPLAGVAIVTTHRDAAYLAAWLGLREVATLEPKPGIPPSAGHLEKVLAGLQARRRIGAEGVHLVRRDDPLGLRADVHEVNEHAVALGAHDDPLDHFTASQ